jgi:hypothetical protein
LEVSAIAENISGLCTIVFIDERISRAAGQGKSANFVSQTRNSSATLDDASTKNHSVFPDDVIPTHREQPRALPKSSACQLNASLEYFRPLEFAEGATN